MSDQTAIKNSTDQYEEKSKEDPSLSIMGEKSNQESETIEQRPEEKQADSDIISSKVGVYICYCGGNISDHVDVERVRERMEKLSDVAVARTNMFMCSDPGQALIINDLKSGLVDRVVVASCAPSLHETTFRSAIERAGANPFIYEHANIREQVSWVHHGDPATEKAAILVAAATAKAKLLKPLQPVRVDAKKHTTVIGGGIAGMTAALSIADRSIDVVLIEKESRLGGELNSLDRLAPTGEIAEEIIETLTRKIDAHERITVFTSCEVTNVEGYVGNFTLSLKNSRESQANLTPDSQLMVSVTEQALKQANLTPDSQLMVSVTEQALKQTNRTPDSQPANDKAAKRDNDTQSLTLETGAIVISTGSHTYTPYSGEFGHGTYGQVITLRDLIANLKGNPAVRVTPEMRNHDNRANRSRFNQEEFTYNGRKIRSIAMIHCVGSRQIPGIHQPGSSGTLNEYCSRTCCSAMLNAALTIRQAFPGTAVFEMYRDIRTYGRGEEELYNSAAENKVIFMRFEAGLEPEVKKMADRNSGRNSDTPDFPLQVTIQDTLTFGETLDVPVDLVVLATGVEPNDLTSLVKTMKLPVGSDGFLLEVHPKLRPVEFPVAGIFLAGTCQAPMSAGEACNAAGAAAAKVSALLSRGFIELPPFVAQVDEKRCNGCGACVEACIKEGALNLVDARKGDGRVKIARVTPALCLGCGACVALCPENAIDLNGWSLKQYEKMVDAIVADGMAA